MTRIKLLTWRCGDRYTQKPGSIVELNDDEAARLVAAGSAVPVSGPECAAVMPQRSAALPMAYKRKRG